MGLTDCLLQFLEMDFSITYQQDSKYGDSSSQLKLFPVSQRQPENKQIRMNIDFDKMFIFAYR